MDRLIDLVVARKQELCFRNQNARVVAFRECEQRCVRCGVVLCRKCGIELGLTNCPKHFGTDVCVAFSLGLMYGWMQMLVLVVSVYVTFPKCSESVVFTNNDIIYTKLVGCEFELGVAGYTALS